VVRIDPGVVSLVADLRAHERQAAEELEQWKTVVEECKTLHASPGGDHARRAADRRGVGLVGEEGWSRRNRGARTTRWIRCRTPSNLLRAMVSLPKYSTPMPRPPTSDRGWMAGSAGVGSVRSGAVSEYRVIHPEEKRRPDSQV
jgi:hypothetical protein